MGKSLKTKGLDMTEKLKKGDHVSWKSSQGTIEGKVVKEVKKPMKIKQHQVSASKSNPEILVKSDKTGAEAAHKATSLKKSSGKKAESDASPQAKTEKKAGKPAKKKTTSTAADKTVKKKATSTAAGKTAKKKTTPTAAGEPAKKKTTPTDAKKKKVASKTGKKS